MGGDGVADGSGYEYEVKRQRLLQGGSAAASGMLASYYYNQPPQQNPLSSSSSSAAAASHSSIVNTYMAPTSASQHPHGSAPSPSGYSSYHQHAHHPAALPSNPSHPAINPNYVSNSGPNLITSAGNHSSSVALMATHPNTANVNVNYMGNSGQILNHTAGTSSAHVPSYPSTGSSAPLSTSLSPFRAGSSPGPLSHHPASSPPPPPLPMMPFERRSPHLRQSPPFSFLKGPGFMQFPGVSRLFPVVRLRGLPFNCTENDVYEFFRGLDVVDVLLTHKQGRFTGEGYCVFGLLMQADLALHRNRQSMGQRYIEVFRSKKQEYYSAVASEVSEQGKLGAGEVTPFFPPSKAAVDKDLLEHTGVLKLRGLPFSASKRDVIDFFKDFDIRDESIQFVVHSDGRASGEAFVEFDGASQSKLAMARDKMMLGSRYVELFPSSSDEAAKSTGRHKR